MAIFFRVKRLTMNCMQILSPVSENFDCNLKVVRMVVQLTQAAVKMQDDGTVRFSTTDAITTHIRLLGRGLPDLYAFQSVPNPSLFLTASEKDGKVIAGPETEFSHFKLFQNSEGSMALLCDAFAKNNTFISASGNSLKFTGNPFINNGHGLFVFELQDESEC
eukprot:m.47787 g.47787  ORF g.47787 m.47787 type:complete len:163 (+) comp33818_c0_seq1:27-515(+)